MIKAAIAIGSNSTRLLAVKESGEALRARAETKLMMGLMPDGTLSIEAMAYTAAAVKELKMQALNFGAQKIGLFATSATRDAKNSREFIERLKAASGLELEIIPGDQEARLAFFATSKGKHCAVLDIGGGSTEATFGEGRRIDFLASAQVGASRMMKEKKIESAADAEIVLSRVRALLHEAFILAPKNNRPPCLVGIGGTCATAAAIKLCSDSHGEELEGTVLTLEDVRGQLSLLSSMPVEKRALVKGLYASRTLIMPHGLCILQAAMELFSFDRLTVSVHNNLDALVPLV